MNPETIESISKLNIPSFFGLVLSVLVGVLIYYLLKQLILFVERQGFGKRLNTSGVRMLLTAVFPAFLIFYVVFKFSNQTSQLNNYVLVLVVGVLIFVISEVLKNILPVFGLVFSSGIREGDQVEIGEYSGELKSIGFFRFVLKIDDDEDFVIPIKLVNQLGLKKHIRGSSYNITVKYPIDKKPEEKLLRKIKNLILFSPYAASGSSVELKTDERYLFCEVDILASKYASMASECFYSVIQNELECGKK